MRPMSVLPATRTSLTERMVELFFVLPTLSTSLPFESSVTSPYSEVSFWTESRLSTLPKPVPFSSTCVPVNVIVPAWAATADMATNVVPASPAPHRFFRMPPPSSCLRGSSPRVLVSGRPSSGSRANLHEAAAERLLSIRGNRSNGAHSADRPGREPTRVTTCERAATRSPESRGPRPAERPADRGPRRVPERSPRLARALVPTVRVRVRVARVAVGRTGVAVRRVRAAGRSRRVRAVVRPARGARIPARVARAARPVAVVVRDDQVLRHGRVVAGVVGRRPHEVVRAAGARARTLAAQVEVRRGPDHDVARRVPVADPVVGLARRDLEGHVDVRVHGVGRGDGRVHRHEL